MGKPYPETLLAAVRDGLVLYAPQKKRVYFRSPKDVYRHLKDPLSRMDKEVFLCCLLNTRNAITRVFIVSVGSLNASIVHPREVFKPAIRHGAASIIVCHNHPSGETDPSEDDLAITRRLRDAGELVGIPLLDHIIIAGDTFSSLKEDGHL